jgi:hypothetical protein
MGGSVVARDEFVHGGFAFAIAVGPLSACGSAELQNEKGPW